MPTAKSAFDHKLANLAQAYGVNRAQLAAAKDQVIYAEQLSEIEAMEHPAEQHLHLAASIVLQAAGHRPPSRQGAA